MKCAACSTENRPGRKFCSECGEQLLALCPACGAINEPGDRFCGECGTALEEAAPAVPEQPAPVSERRLASILFADLVGFTPLSEGRDPELVRELLSRYFELAATIVGRHGGVIEKFIGDAVVAVWGTPVAQEDDAERAVRTALELAAAVQDLEPGLSMRAAVSTGEVAVTVGAQSQGMVAGDVVNTTARMQAAAPSGGVLVDDATRRATEAAILCEPAGPHELKGKAEPVQLWHARHVVAERGGRRRSVGLEPPFVGRSRELRQMQELLHVAADESRAQLVTVTGVAGIGKSRLAWELEKYVDGLTDDFLFHRGRCLSYGDGVAFWAVAEMVRMRARIAEDEDSAGERAKLDAVLAEHLPDPDEREWVRPALLHLLGLEELSGADRSRLFASWRLFFERMADRAPVMLVFEDIQWADQAMLEFVEYLLEWSRDRPLFVLALARPELADSRPGFGSASRSHTSLVLEPFADPTMRELLRGLRLPAEVIEPIIDRAEGIPLYAVETVRMLIDRGALTPVDDGFRADGDVTAVEIPETLHALVLARLDALAPRERTLLQDASVLGKMFTLEGLHAVSTLGDADVGPGLEVLVRRELLSIESDPRSPERGLYGFVQALVRTVAYETMGLRDRKRRHLAAARHLAAIDQGDELVELIATHTLDAYRLVQDDADTGGLRAEARELLLRAAERARSLAAPSEARRLTLSALELADDERGRALMLAAAGKDALAQGEPIESRALLERALAIHTAAGDETGAAHVLARLGDALFIEGRPDEAVGLIEQSYETLRPAGDTPELAEIAAQYGRILFLAGDGERYIEPLEQAIDLGERLHLPEVLSDALNTRALGLVETRPETARTMMDGSLRIALEADLPIPSCRAYFNLSYLCECADLDGRSLDREGMEIAKRLGDRGWENAFRMHILSYDVVGGDWDAALAASDRLARFGLEAGDIFIASSMLFGTMVKMRRGDVGEARREFEEVGFGPGHSDPQLRLQASWVSAALLLAEGRPAEAADVAAELWPDSGVHLVIHAFTVPAAFVGTTALMAVGDRERLLPLREWIDQRPVGLRPPMMRALRLWMAAWLGEGDPDEAFTAAAALLGEIPRPWERGIVLEAHADSLRSRGQHEAARARLAEAAEAYSGLGALPALERVRAAMPPDAAVSAG